MVLIVQRLPILTLNLVSVTPQALLIPDQAPTLPSWRSKRRIWARTEWKSPPAPTLPPTSPPTLPTRQRLRAAARHLRNSQVPQRHLRLSLLSSLSISARPWLIPPMAGGTLRALRNCLSTPEADKKTTPSRCMPPPSTLPSPSKGRIRTCNQRQSLPPLTLTVARAVTEQKRRLLPPPGW